MGKISKHTPKTSLNHQNKGYKLPQKVKNGGDQCNHHDTQFYGRGTNKPRISESADTSLCKNSEFAKDLNAPRKSKWQIKGRTVEKQISPMKNQFC